MSPPHDPIRADPPTPALPDMAGLILDGGKATRFGGCHKAFLVVDGRPIAARTVELFRRLFAEVIVATNRPEPWQAFDVRVVMDPIEEAGPLAGLVAGLRACRQRRLFAAAGDMPHLAESVILALAARAEAGDADAVVPVVDGRPEPLHAVYAARLAERAEQALAGGARKLTDVLAGAPVDWVAGEDLAHLPGSGATFRNVNRPQDLPPEAR